MKIVIKISNELYDLIKHYERSLEIIEEENDTLEITLMRAIIKGTPLPEQHTNEVLEKIRTEIKALSNANPSYTHTCDVVDREDVLDIIDKYIEGSDSE